ncbi:DNA-processing protein DprA [Vagococcus silagei]|uniref:DNA-protecting protein DprA n=1 Tax=Vagococcus silagei TaxID=2508885 RepID=A0A4V3TV46_9ENTE|nr:DNA-processing protein DprA [Vagococcus silagei]THB61469.1 DNA-protecting protein DprA [Vagococcus silagei]
MIAKVKKAYQEIFTTSFWQSFGTITEDDFSTFQHSYQFITILDDTYPERLAEIYNPPIALFLEGDIDLLENETLAVIGARKSTTYGKQMIEKIIPTIIKEKITIVSGLAKGSDTNAHIETIKNGGQTIAVIGCGLDIYYPKENKKLQDYISQEHLIISEYLPTVPPLSYHFPSRNRIIAGLSKGVCVIEAQKKSGTFITASLALEEGRDVFAVPGSAFEKTSEGCLELIQEGAKCIWKPEDILLEWNIN